MIDDFEYMQPLSATFANNAGPHVRFHELAAPKNTAGIAPAAVSASDLNLDTIVADANPIEQVADMHNMTKGSGATANLHSTGSLYTAIGQDDVTDGVLLHMKNGSIPVHTSGGISEALLHRVVSLEGSGDPGAYAGGQSAAESAVAGDAAADDGDDDGETKEDDAQQEYKPSPPPPPSPDGRRTRPLQLSDLDAPAAPKGPKPPSRANASTVRAASAQEPKPAPRASSKAAGKLRRSIALAEGIESGLKASVQRKREDRARRRGRGVPEERFNYDSRLESGHGKKKRSQLK